MSYILLKFVSWCFDREGTPVLIPNTEVKLLRTDGTPQGEEQVGANLQILITKAHRYWCVFVCALTERVETVWETVSKGCRYF